MGCNEVAAAGGTAVELDANYKITAAGGTAVPEFANSKNTSPGRFTPKRLDDGSASRPFALEQVRRNE
jgi:hypothetical protein